MSLRRYIPNRYLSKWNYRSDDVTKGLRFDAFEWRRKINQEVTYINKEWHNPGNKTYSRIVDINGCRTKLSIHSTAFEDR